MLERDDIPSEFGKMLRIVLEYPKQAGAEKAYEFLKEHGSPEIMKLLLEFIQRPWAHENDQGYLWFRRNLAWLCLHLARKHEGTGLAMVCQCYPDLPNEVEGKDINNRIRRGRFGTSCGTSIFEFHYDYPILGSGVTYACRKDTISVIEDDGSRISLFDWSVRTGQRVLCMRCGIDVTTEVNLLGCYASLLRKMNLEL